MRYRWLTILLVLAATQPFASTEIQHLLGRSGFVPGIDELQRYKGLGYEAAVSRMLSETLSIAQTPPPDWLNVPLPDRRQLRSASEEQKKAFKKQLRQRRMALKAWWYEEMLATDSPLTERMTLFWHNHFTSSLKKVKSPHLMYRQNVLLRSHALGSFSDMLFAITRDPAMVLYLDSASNRKGKPNENFARELLELFTLGEGRYTETDIKEVARAFTGWGVDRQSGEFRFRSRLHDDGVKEVFGRRGRFDGDDVIGMILERPEVSELVVRKLWREFVSPDPDENEVRQLAEGFRTNGYAIKPLLFRLFTGDAFRSPVSRGQLIKSPVELIVGTLRLFQVPIREARPLAFAGRQLGQDLLDPPNVKGWEGGRAWIDSNTLLLRRQLIERFVSAGQHGMNARGWMRSGARQSMNDTRLIGRWLDDVERAGLDPMALLLTVPAAQPSQSKDAEQAVIAALMDPAYQLK